MSNTSLDLNAGTRVSHSEFGAGVFIATEPGGYARVFFQEHGERQVPTSALSSRSPGKRRSLPMCGPPHRKR